MAQLFLVKRTRGPAWNDGLPMEEQVDWRLHADFMNDLHARGITLLAGPITGTRDVLLVFRAETEAEVEARLAEDCWSVKGLLQTSGSSPGGCVSGPYRAMGPLTLPLTLWGLTTTFSVPFPGREAPLCNSRNAT